MTNLYLTTATATAPSAAEPTRWRLAGGPGGLAHVCNKNTIAGPVGTPLLATDSQTAGTDGNPVGWYSDALAAVTIAGTITASLWGMESASTANAAPTIGVYRCDASGLVLSTIVDPLGAASQGALEFPTNPAVAKTCTVTSGVVSTALAAGDRLKVTLTITDASTQGGSGTMNSGKSCQMYVNGQTGQAGQSQIAFTETLLSAQVGLVFPITAGRPVTAGRQVPSIISGI